MNTYRMSACRIAMILAGLVALEAPGVEAAQMPARQFERLDRGVVAVPALGGGNLVSWRLLVTDPAETAFSVYRDGKKLNTAPITATTNYRDESGVPS